jgi:DNA-binding XRE family transcriptional regulator
MVTAACNPPARRRSRTRRAPLVALKALRVNHGLSREMLALRAGVSRETIRLAEAGYLPTPRVQFAIAAAFGKLPLDIWPIERQGSGR